MPPVGGGPRPPAAAAGEFVKEDGERVVDEHRAPGRARHDPRIHARARRLVAEGLGTGLLVATVVGSGIMAERLAGGNEARRTSRQHYPRRVRS